MPDDILNKRMTFGEWETLLNLRAKLVSDNTEVDRRPWRCTGACGQLMYGQEWIDGKLYPSSENTPAGMFISKDIPHVCHVCWEMYHVLENSPTSYWMGITEARQKKYKKLLPGSDYLST